MNSTQIKAMAKQALRYLASLKQPLPEASNTAFYEQNRADYQSLLTLNKKGLGSTEEELTKLATMRQVKTIVKDLVALDSKHDEIADSEWFTKHWECVNRRTQEYKLTKRAQGRLETLSQKISAGLEELVLALKSTNVKQQDFADICEATQTHWEIWVGEDDQQDLGWT